MQELFNLQGQQWPKMPSSALALSLCMAATAGDGPIAVLVPDAHVADTLQASLTFFAPNDLPILYPPEREMLPYDFISPAREITSRRAQALAQLPQLRRGLVIATADLVLERLPPPTWLSANSLSLKRGSRLDLHAFRNQLVNAGYLAVSEVRAPGEFAIRGEVLDIYPSGLPSPVRIDLFDDEIETLRSFNPESQISDANLSEVILRPAWEFPNDASALKRFRTAWRSRFSGDPMESEIYRQISQGHIPPGIESWLPLFFEETSNFAEYLPQNTAVYRFTTFNHQLEETYREVHRRYESERHDLSRPLLSPDELFYVPDQTQAMLSVYKAIGSQGADDERILPLPNLEMHSHSKEPLHAFLEFRKTLTKAIICCESAGRRETVREMFVRRTLHPVLSQSWSDALTSQSELLLCIGSLEDGFQLPETGLAILPESAIFGARVNARRRSQRARDPATIIRDLTDLQDGTPVVHQDYGIGRFRGLVTREVDNHKVEFVLLEYADNDRLYVPVASLERLSRYIGADAEHAPITHLGTGQWDRARRRASARARDSAAELLELYARRQLRAGTSMTVDPDSWERFLQEFPFEETPDQKRASEEVVADLASTLPMDRLVCGDVGFGKTEIAFRAAFIAVHSGQQVAMLVPTTLLAEQHLRNFRDRFSEWPVRIELLSRFRKAGERNELLGELSDGKIDIVIGTHALLSRDVGFKSLGLLIVDEEHRFGVRHKEKLRKLRAEVDILTLTATPIPRTLSMTLSGIRGLSIIATPPENRLPIQTTVCQWQDARLHDAITRELRRGGQVFVVHNEVKSISGLAERLSKLVPEARIEVGHGQMPERRLEQLMVDFYHRKFDILVATTIIESGIDVPTANTILIHNAHRFGLAQLHQLRGRVGRSHHQAFAYLITPPLELLNRAARSRLDAVQHMEELGAGFFLATQDLEIRGAGVLLGDEQSGQLTEVGLELYNRLLGRAVKTLKNGEIAPESDELEPEIEVDLGTEALLPSNYIPDVHTRLVLYKRIASAENLESLTELSEEIVDRFGSLPKSTQNLLEIARIKQQAKQIGITKIWGGPTGVRLEFSTAPNLDAKALVQLVQSDPHEYRLRGNKQLDVRRTVESDDERFECVKLTLQTIAADRNQA